MAHSKYRIIENGQPHFVTCTVSKWMPVFLDASFSSILLKSLDFLLSSTDMRLYGFIIMPNHIHMIVSSIQLQNKISRFKSYTARKCIDLLIAGERVNILHNFELQDQNRRDSRMYHFWVEGCHPELIQGETMMRQKLEYIHKNPVRAGLVDTEEEWRLSSYSNYYHKCGVIDVDTEW